jgi:hypothetical protein
MKTIKPLLYQPIAIVVVLALSLRGFGWPSVTHAQAPIPQQQAIDWLISQQREDGGWSDTLGPVSGAGITADAVLALWANGVDLESLPASPLDFLESYTNRNALDLPTRFLPKLVLAALAGGRDLRDFGGVDLLTVMGQPPAGQWWGGDSYQHSLWLLAWAAADQPRPSAALAQVVQAQREDGSWLWGEVAQEVEAEGDPFSTAMALLALAAWGDSNPAGEAWLLERVTSAGVALTAKSDPDAYTTATVLLALRQQPKSNQTLQAALLTFQSDSGAFLYQADGLENMGILMTPQVLLALAPKTLLDLGQ